MTRILLVDDESVWRTMIDEGLPEYQVDQAANFVEARALVRGEALYDAAIVDLNLVDGQRRSAGDASAGDLLGGEILRELCRVHPWTRRIALTGEPPTAVRRQVFDRYDVDDLLIKSNFKVADLREVVRAAVARSLDDIPLEVAEQKLELWEDFRSWQESTGQRLGQQLRSLENDLRGGGRLRAEDAEARAALTALKARLAVLKRRRDAFRKQCSKVEATLAAIASTADVSVTSGEVDALKRTLDANAETV